MTMVMGCYGMGISRLVGAAIEQNNDEHGIIWPESIAPFTAVLIPVNAHKSEIVRDVSNTLYDELIGLGVDVLSTTGTAFVPEPSRGSRADRHSSSHCDWGENP